jgi:hypothetical protein
VVLLLLAANSSFGFTCSPRKIAHRGAAQQPHAAIWITMKCTRPAAMLGFLAENQPHSRELQSHGKDPKNQAYGG